ncbi:steroid 5-alpha-reductase DET2 isoform X2 [Lycium ferocissimum]|uniref:steroid 5-alpha-reductase DET2 isoform X2 n=1 Tax=Lycium ferocissimum TaxID=112874 RepID=UPI002815CD4D|nr:steroid 5-alpha-reductase DET2 isoform X2 [Lycium ferocissimum]
MFSDENLFNFIIFFILLMSLPTFILAQFFTSPYGKHKRSCNSGGMVVNVWADGVLLGLKSEGVGYKIPRSGLFEYVSSPNYLGEIVEWLGWALMTWSWAGLAFFVYTCANLVPRAVSNHKWYLEKFGEDYPKNRKAVFPFLY